MPSEHQVVCTEKFKESHAQPSANKATFNQMLCMTLLVRNEESILSTNIEYHLRRGVDFIISTDNLSTDATADILRDYERQGVLRYIFEPQDDYSQDIWVTRMARMAKTEYNADWLIHVDADEFWWPERHRTLPAALAEIPTEVDGIHVARSNFVRPIDMDETIPFEMAMTVRDLESVNPLGRPLPGKIAHRASTAISVDQGNHDFRISGRTRSVSKSSELLVFHYPMRDFPSFEQRIVEGGAAYARNTRLNRNIGRTWRDLYEQHQAGTLGIHFRNHCIDNTLLESRLNSGRYVCDFRFRDFIRSQSDQFTVVGKNLKKQLLS